MSEEPVVSRIVRLNQLILGKGCKNLPDQHLIHRDGLLDALLALYDECNTKHMKKNSHISSFVEKTKSVIDEIRSMRVSLNDFEAKKVIGRGNFGEVQVAREKSTGDVYAMKVLRKAETLAHQCAAFYEEERDIMAQSASPWITKLQYAFQDSQNLYLVMEFHPGGDMLTLLEKYTVLSEDMARFYVAELVLAIHSVHSMGYAHRDIKPDNILIDRTGHIKLADFGSAAKLDSNNLVTSKMPVGTPDYIAPEVLVSVNEGQRSKNGYGPECDWWSLGIVAYEMLFGTTPFADNKLLIVYNNIMNFKKSLKFPEEAADISCHFIDMIQGVLTEAEHRLNFEKLLAHGLFSEVDWNNIRQTVPPYVPTVSGQDDTSNFDDFDHEVRPSLTELQTKTEFTGKDLPFIGFTYIAPFESFTQRFSGTECSVVSPQTCNYERASSKYDAELQNKIASVATEGEYLKHEIQKLQSSMRRKGKKYESEICRLEDEIISLEADKKELMRLLRLEREDRILTEKKASQILKCMKKRRRRQSLNLQVSKSVKSDISDSHLSVLEQLEDALAALEESEVRELGAGDGSHSGSQQSRKACPNETQEFRPLIEEESEVPKQELQENDSSVLEAIKVENCHLKEQLEHALSINTGLLQELEQTKSRFSDCSIMLPCQEMQHIACEVQCNIWEEQPGGDICWKKLLTENQHLKNEITVLENARSEIQQQAETMTRKILKLEHDLQRAEEQQQKTRTDTDVPKIVSDSEIQNNHEQISSKTEKQMCHCPETTGPLLVQKGMDYHSEFESKVCGLQQKLEALEASLRQEKDRSASFEKQLKEKTDRVSELELDLRIATREKKRSEEFTATLRENNRNLREQLKSSEKEVADKLKSEDELNAKVKELETQLSSERRSIAEKIETFEINKAKLEERMRSVQEMLESHKDIGQIYAKNQGQYVEIAKENEKLKWESNLKESEKSQLLTEMEMFKKELSEKKQECMQHQKVISTLKKMSTELEEQLKEFEFLEKVWEDDLKASEAERKKLLENVCELQEELKKKTTCCAEERKLREELQHHVVELEEDIETQQSIHEAETQCLGEQVQHQKKTIEELESHISDIEKELVMREHNSDINVRRNMTLEEELVQMKEECAKHITQIASLKSSNMKLTQALEDAMENQNRCQSTISSLQSDVESLEAKFSHEKVKMHETISQQAKLIDFLQGKAETMEKKRKGLNVPRLFGKKENPGMTWRNTEGLEQERIRCRRLQDQLSQARAENLALKNELNQHTHQSVSSSQKSSVPISPVSRALHSALTASPTTGDGKTGPLLVSHETANKFMKLQGMKHRIPHRFNEILCMRGSKCAACLDSIHFGRPAAKCQECCVLCHTKCASSLPNTCGLPSGFIQHFKSAFSSNLESQNSVSSGAKPEGWVKVPKSSKQGWERRYICIVDSVLYLFEDSCIQDKEKAVDYLDFAAEGGEVVVISAVSPTELQNAAKSDLPFLLKIEYHPRTTCWPPRCLYLMADSFTDKQMWVSNLEALVKKCKKPDDQSSANILSEKVVLSLKGESFVDILCTFVLDERTLLIGAVEGLFIAMLNTHGKGSLKHKILGVESVYQMTLMTEIGIVIFISGEQRNLNMIKVEILDSAVQRKSSLQRTEVECICDIKDCHLFSVQEVKVGSTYHLCCATASSVTLLRWDSNENCFCKRKVIMSHEPCSCILFTQSSVIYGSDKFYELDLKNCTLEEFLDCTDASLAGLVYGASQFRSFPISVFNISLTNQPDEYLVCFHEFGVFVDGFGQRTRPDDMKWSRLPLSFAYQSPYLFVTHFNSLEVIEILPSTQTDKGRHTVIDIPSPQYLGPAVFNGAIYVASCQDRSVELLCIEGSLPKKRTFEEMNNPIDDSEDGSLQNPNSCEKETVDRDGDDDLDFSFSNSLIHSLDAASGDNLSLSSSASSDSARSSM